MRRLCSLILVVSFAAAPAVATAHNLGFSLLELHPDGNRVEAAIAFHAEELGLVPRDPSGDLAQEEVDASRQQLLAATWEQLGLAVPAGGCAKEQPEVRPDPLGGVRILGTFRCPGPADGGFDAALGYLADLEPGHRVVGEVRFGARWQAFTADASSPQIALRPEGGSGFADFFLLGVEHIFTGFDHLLFLAGLLLVAASLGEVVKLVTAFTVAHSLTLGASVLGVVDFPSSVVEPLIAATLIFVAVENLLRRRVRGRVALTFAFGLVHGFGFAGLLRELGLGQGNVVATLAGFNLGVEAGQVAVVLAVAPPLLLFRRQPWYARTAVPGCSALIAAFGAYWLVERLLG